MTLQTLSTPTACQLGPDNYCADGLIPHTHARPHAVGRTAVGPGRAPLGAGPRTGDRPTGSERGWAVPRSARINLRLVVASHPWQLWLRDWMWCQLSRFCSEIVHDVFRFQLCAVITHKLVSLKVALLPLGLVWLDGCQAADTRSTR